MTFLGETLEGKHVLLFTENILFIEEDEKKNCINVRLKEGLDFYFKLPELAETPKDAIDWIAQQLSE